MKDAVPENLAKNDMKRSFGSLFQAKKRGYQDLGVRLIARLVRERDLPGWGSDLLPTYSAEEIEAINSGWASFQRLADDEGGGAPGSTSFHPDAAAEIRRKIAGEELMSYADRLCRFTNDLPPNWKVAASAYLKSWSATLDPSALQNLGELLVKADHIDDARETFTLILSFPAYAPNVYGSNQDELIRMVVEHAKHSLSELENK
jgi:hypothetical protein